MVILLSTGKTTGSNIKKKCTIANTSCYKDKKTLNVAYLL
jgi:hypothetical protein